jgi:hypothetical protein
VRRRTTTGIGGTIPTIPNPRNIAPIQRPGSGGLMSYENPIASNSATTATKTAYNSQISMRMREQCSQQSSSEPSWSQSKRGISSVSGTGISHRATRHDRPRSRGFAAA